MPFFQHAGIDFHYMDVGEGVPFIFLHGLGGNVKQPFEVYQAQAGIRFLSLDGRGHGETRPLGDADQLRFNTFADDVIALMDHLQLASAIIGGISMGAGVSLNLAVRYSGRVLGLVVSRPAWLDEPMPANLWILTEVARYIRRYGAARGLEQFKQTEAHQVILQEAPDVANSLVSQFTHPRAEETVAKLERMPHDAPNTHRNQWAAIHVPTLILANHVDPMHPYELAETLAQAIPAAQFHELTSKSVDKPRHIQEARQFIKMFLQQFIST